MESFAYEISSLVSSEGLTPWLLYAGLSVLLTLIVKGVLHFASSRLRVLARNTQSRVDDIILDLVDGLKSPILTLWIFSILTQSLPQNESLRRGLLTVVVISTSVQIMIWGFYVIKNWHNAYLTKHVVDNPSSAAALGLLYTAVQAVFIVLIVLMALSNLGVNITALIAGLGVGGIAVALAAQNVLGDLLASLSIVFDKPFVIGDFIVAGSQMGTVENIGVKTTRLRSLSGEQLVLSNKDILESRIQNFKSMEARRIVQNFRISYFTSAEKIERISFWVKEIVVATEKTQFDRCHFKGYGDSYLDFEFVFIVQDPDYNLYMDIQQKILLSIFRKFKAEKVEFAFPTTNVRLESDTAEMKT